MARVAVVGAGITGLSCAHFLAARGIDTVVYEASDRVGGKLSTGAIGGVPVELGADSFLPRDELPLELCRAAGVAHEIVSPVVFGAYIYLDGKLRRVPEGSPYGIPVRPWDAWRAGLLSFGAALGVATSGVKLETRLRGPDVSIGSFLRRRFGDEVVDHLVAPLLGGTRAGDPDEISLAAGAREIDALARTRRSLRKALVTSGTDIGATSRRFSSIRGGIERLPEALAERLPDVQTNAPIEDISELDADAVVVTTPAFAAGPLVKSVAPAAADGLAALEYHSSAIVVLLYPPATFEFPADGSGALIPRDQGLSMTGCTWYSHKWGDARPADGSQIVRCFFSAPEPEDLPNRPRLIEAAGRELGTVMGRFAEPADVHLTRWPRGQPLYSVGHLRRIDRIEKSLPRNVMLAGAAYRGSGIPDCIHDAHRAAERVAAVLEGRGR